MNNMIQVQIDSVRVHLMTPNRLVVLKQVNEDRFLPIWVGIYEAEALTVALQEVEVRRPLTHDLLKNVFGAFNARITRIEIVKLENDTFFGAIIAESNGTNDYFLLRVRVPVTTLCPCSKQMSAKGAHNQRGIISIKIKFRGLFWIEDVIKIAEKSASCEVYSLLQRPDEKHVTDKAYTNPMFVEDVGAP